MIRFIAAIDSKRGLADDSGIPWDLPSDRDYYRAKVKHHPYVIGYNTYAQHTKPLDDTPTYVATNSVEELRPGFTKVADASEFIKSCQEDVWVGGGAGLFASTLDLADELYLTRIGEDFKCTKFFPNFENDFELISQSDPQKENDITFRYEVWKRK